MARGEAEDQIISVDPKRGPIYSAYIPTSMLCNIYIIFSYTCDVVSACISGHKTVPISFGRNANANQLLNERCTNDE